MKTRLLHTSIVLVLGALFLSFVRLPIVGAWGEHGHRISGRAAATNLPAEMPAFFRDAAPQLEYLNPEPDRWRERDLAAMNEAFRYDHYVDLEVIPKAALETQDRFAYLSALSKGGVKDPEKSAGLLPFRILELYQRLVVEFRLWRKTADAQTRQFIQHRIINDAGVLGHYATDGANPHHTTVHHNGWARGYANPNNYTTDNTFHSRFETQYVTARIALGDLLPQMRATPTLLTNPRQEVVAYLRSSHAQLERLYQLDKEARFDAQTTAPANKRFAVDRLVAGVEMLRALWWSAWRNSGSESQAPASAEQPNPATTTLSASQPTAPKSGGTTAAPKTSVPKTAPAGATAECRDGTYSFSSSRRGTCSHHGGVKRWL